MKAIAILATILISASIAHAQKNDYLERNHKFHKHTEKSEHRTISSAITAVQPVELNRKFHMTKADILPVPVQTAGHDNYMTRNRKFHKTNLKEEAVEKRFNNNLQNPPVLSSK
jgi:hypothetical protein